MAYIANFSTSYKFETNARITELSIDQPEYLRVNICAFSQIFAILNLFVFVRVIQSLCMSKIIMSGIQDTSVFGKIRIISALFSSFSYFAFKFILRDR